jgi:hypothetical protein
MFQDGQRLAGDRVPDPGRVIVAARGERLAVGAERESDDLLLVPLDVLPGLTGQVGNGSVASLRTNRGFASRRGFTP